MSAPEDTGSAGVASDTGQKGEKDRGGSRLLWIETGLFMVLIVLSIVGVGVADFSAQRALGYWLAMVPIFAAVNVYGGWSRAKRLEQPTGWIIGKQLLHWASLALAIYLVHLLQEQGTGRLNNETAGLVALLALALTTLLAGIHFDWRFAVLGVVLGLLVLLAAILEAYLWLAILIGLVGAALILFLRHMEHRGRSSASRAS